MGPRIEATLKRDTFGAVERVVARDVDGADVRLIRRVVAPPPRWAWTGHGWVALLLARREARALGHLAAQDVGGIARAPRLDDETTRAVAELPSASGLPVQRGRVFVRPFADGAPLHRAERLPRDFFD
ncbi:MAG: hypothetical protein AAFR54_21795, partial [Planctomycetota bacterium]